MRVYKAGELFVVGTDGGSFEGLSQQSEAIILRDRPIPSKMWRTPTEVMDNPFKQESWEYDYTFTEFQTGGDRS
jgi:hypothetical protein